MTNITRLLFLISQNVLIVGFFEPGLQLLSIKRKKMDRSGSREIRLLSVLYKLLSSILLTRGTVFMDTDFSENQCGFLCGSSTVIVTLIDKTEMAGV
jgi:hypothetical protein